MKIVCQTERLILRHFQLSDAEFIIRLLNEESFIRYISDKKVRTRADAENYLINGPIASYTTYGFGLNMVELKESGKAVGMCGILKRPELDYPDLGYALLAEHWGHGYACEAAEGALNDGLSNHSLRHILAVTLPENKSSNALLKKIGFNQIGELELHNSPNNLYEYRKSCE